MRRCDGIIFDLDGTLIDSLPDIAAALNHALRAHRQTPLDDTHVRGLIGDGLPRLCARAWPGATPIELQSLVRAAETRYQAHCTDATRIYPNILSSLELLKSKNLRMAVLTNKPHALALLAVNDLGLAPFFDVTCGYVNETDRKPAPDAALRIAREWGIEPCRVAIVGDSEVDVATARNAGMIAVAATWGYRDRETLVAAGPDRLIDAPSEISSVI